jgi:hypothetical protein
MSARRKMLVITSCSECCHITLTKRCSHPALGSNWRFTPHRIPDWCPLPNAPENAIKKYEPEPETLLTDLTMLVRQHGVEPQ